MSVLILSLWPDSTESTAYVIPWWFSLRSTGTYVKYGNHICAFHQRIAGNADSILWLPHQCLHPSFWSSSVAEPWFACMLLISMFWQILVTNITSQLLHSSPLIFLLSSFSCAFPLFYFPSGFFFLSFFSKVLYALSLSLSPLSTVDHLAQTSSLLLSSLALTSIFGCCIIN